MLRISILRYFHVQIKYFHATLILFIQLQGNKYFRIANKAIVEFIDSEICELNSILLLIIY